MTAYPKQEEDKATYLKRMWRRVKAERHRLLAAVEERRKQQQRQDFEKKYGKRVR